MNELEKMNRIIKREVPDAPHETLLVIDATTGQNGVSQAVEFSKITDVSGLVLTKMDGTAKGGDCSFYQRSIEYTCKIHWSRRKC